MTVTVRANGLTISHKDSGGYVRNSTPDVCLTPSGPVPVAYSIISFSRDLVRGTTTVFADGGHMISNRGSAYSRCTGDEPGTAKGIISGTHLHEATWITFSPNVRVDGKNICRKTDKMFMNNRNCISGDGGDMEIDFSFLDDPVERELCAVFCKVREQYHKCRPNCPESPSRMAQKEVDSRLGNRNSPLNRAVRQRHPNGAGIAEGRFRGLVDDAFDGACRIFNESQLRQAVERRLRRVLSGMGVQAFKRLGRRTVMRMVPGLNLFAGVLDVIDLAMTANDIYNAVRSAETMVERAGGNSPRFRHPGPRW